MSEIERIARQLTASMNGPAWHGPSVREAIKGVGYRRAIARPLRNGHTIYEITHHIAGWIDVVRRRLDGETVGLPPDGDFPEKTPTEKGWRETQSRLKKAHEALLAMMKGLRDDELNRPLRRGGPTRYVLLHGLVQHNLYHAGQIALLKKA